MIEFESHQVVLNLNSNEIYRDILQSGYSAQSQKTSRSQRHIGLFRLWKVQAHLITLR